MYQGLHSETSTTDPQAPYSGEYTYETLKLGKEMTAPDSSLFLDSTANLSINIPSNLFDIMPNGVAYGRMLYKDDNPHDFVYLYTNPAFHSLTGLGAVKGKLISEIIPGIRLSDPEFIKIYTAVAAGGLAQHVEIFIDALQLWLSIQVFSSKPEGSFNSEVQS